MSDQPNTTDDEFLNLAEEIVGTSWIPIRRQRLDLEIRIAEALANASASAQMAEAERKLLIWCAIMLVRSTPLTPKEADEIDQLIADVRAPLPKIVWDTPELGPCR